MSGLGSEVAQQAMSLGRTGEELSAAFTPATVVESMTMDAAADTPSGTELRFVSPGYHAQLDKLAGNLVARFSAPEPYGPGYHSGDAASWPGDVLGAD